jgi:hypothetical protein
MAVRDGMSNLIARVRSLANAGTAEYTVGGDTYWTDQQIQDILDGNSQFIVDSRLHWQEQDVSGTSVYYTAQAAYRDFEEADSGTARWAVRDGPGNLQSTANYTADYRSGRITWSANQDGTIYYLTAYTYDVHAAAADIWQQRMAHFSDWYDFRADNQSFSRSQAFEHAQKMEDAMRARVGANVVGQPAGGFRTGVFYRTDLNG